MTKDKQNKKFKTTFFKDLKDFFTKGNVLNLAVGVIIGAAFGKITASLVSDIIMPPIGLLVGGVDFKELVITIKKPVLDAAGEVLQHAVTINYGNFIQTIVEFLIIGVSVFCLLRWLTKLTNNLSRIKEETVKQVFKNKNGEEAVAEAPAEAEAPAVTEEAAPAEPPAPEINRTEALLEEICTLLKDLKKKDAE